MPDKITWAAFRSKLPRIYELKALLPAKAPPNAYFSDFERSLIEYPQKLKFFEDLEHRLRGLDADAWKYLKGEAAPLLVTKHETRGWQQLFDKLNQARAYNYLVVAGWENIRFVPESKMSGQSTPDLQASKQGQKCLCEVKTVNVSDAEVRRFHSRAVQDVADQLSSNFFSKLGSTLEKAKAQLDAFCDDSNTKLIAYIVLNFDDRLHEYADRYEVQIRRFLADQEPPELDVVLDIKTAFHSA